MTATTPEEHRELNIRETIVHIDQMIADTRRKNQEYQFAPWLVLATVLGGAAAFFAAGAAFVKLLGG